MPQTIRMNSLQHLKPSLNQIPTTPVAQQHKRALARISSQHSANQLIPANPFSTRGSSATSNTSSKSRYLVTNRSGAT